MQKSKEGRIRNHSGDLDHLEQNKPPAAVSIDDMLDEDIGDISSSSEIEIDEPLGKFAILFRLRGTDNSLPVLLSSWNYGYKYAKY